ncbi:hypothetical protein B0H13DRAFT_2085776 [Mycena leptocephala]|nr:hypothetical protein B0H13DRAFT_2085776 [Mycena leptocephala]
MFLLRHHADAHLSPFPHHHPHTTMELLRPTPHHCPLPAPCDRLQPNPIIPLATTHSTTVNPSPLPAPSLYLIAIQPSRSALDATVCHPWCRVLNTYASISASMRDARCIPDTRRTSSLADSSPVASLRSAARCCRIPLLPFATPPQYHPQHLPRLAARSTVISSSRTPPPSPYGLFP